MRGGRRGNNKASDSVRRDADGIDDEGIAFPAPDRVAEQSGRELGRMLCAVHVDDTLLQQAFPLVTYYDRRFTHLDRAQVLNNRQVKRRTRLAESCRRDARLEQRAPQLLASRTPSLRVGQSGANELDESGEAFDRRNPLT